MGPKGPATQPGTFHVSKAIVAWLWNRGKSNAPAAGGKSHVGRRTLCKSLPLHALRRGVLSCESASPGTIVFLGDRYFAFSAKNS